MCYTLRSITGVIKNIHIYPFFTLLKLCSTLFFSAHTHIFLETKKKLKWRRERERESKEKDK